jgi:hypothetical protein
MPTRPQHIIASGLKLLLAVVVILSISLGTALLRIYPKLYSLVTGIQ